jgi:hypothetical protein
MGGNIFLVKVWEKLALDIYVAYLCIIKQQQNSQNMKTIIFKNEKKAKAYEIRSAKAQGCYSKGELMMRIKTDNIAEALSGWQYETTVTEI